MQQTLFAAPASPDGSKNQTTFVDNLKLPIHRWFRFSAGYSAGWAEKVILDDISASGRTETTVLDPFAGSGTTLLAASATGSASVGWEAQDLIHRVAQAKVGSLAVDPGELLAATDEVISDAVERAGADAAAHSHEAEPALLQKCYSSEALRSLRSLQGAIDRRRVLLPPDLWNLLWLNLVSILRPVSHVGTAQWQYVLPNKSKARTVSALDGFRLKAQQMAEDIDATAEFLTGPITLLRHDARAEGGAAEDSVDLVVTSPPYANNFDYADATRLEMTFLGEIQTWGDLKVVRESLVHACSQHMTGYDADAALSDPSLAPIVDRLEPIYEELDAVRQTKGGKKAYHAMVVAYFFDMARVWHELRRAVRPGGRALFVVGDSAPYGVYVPVEVMHGELAVAAGFESYSFDKSRYRNIKWKNRKHRVPLKEGVLEVSG